jgi:hypothetical protein
MQRRHILTVFQQTAHVIRWGMDLTQTLAPALQPDASANRMVWMAWEQLWDKAAATKDPSLLARLIGAGIDTPEKQNGAHRIFSYWAEYPNKYEGKLMRLLLRNDAKISPSLVAPLCACGMRAVELMKKHQVDLTTTNLAGENGLSLACLINNEKEFTAVWTILRDEGLDPAARDDTLETAWDAAEKYGKTALAERLEEERHRRAQATQQAVDLDKATPATKNKRQRASRL